MRNITKKNYLTSALFHCEIIKKIISHITRGARGREVLLDVYGHTYNKIRYFFIQLNQTPDDRGTKRAITYKNN
jgi:hypothetical protein